MLALDMPHEQSFAPARFSPDRSYSHRKFEERPRIQSEQADCSTDEKRPLRLPIQGNRYVASAKDSPPSPEPPAESPRHWQDKKQRSHRQHTHSYDEEGKSSQINDNRPRSALTLTLMLMLDEARQYLDGSDGRSCNIGRALELYHGAAQLGSLEARYFLALFLRHESKHQFYRILHECVVNVNEEHANNDERFLEASYMSSQEFAALRGRLLNAYGVALLELESNTSSSGELLRKATSFFREAIPLGSVCAVCNLALCVLMSAEAALQALSTVKNVVSVAQETHYEEVSGSAMVDPALATLNAGCHLPTRGKPSRGSQGGGGGGLSLRLQTGSDPLVRQIEDVALCALKSLRVIFEEGDGRVAPYNLGVAFERGSAWLRYELQRQTRRQEAVHYYRKAAREGFVPAMLALAKLSLRYFLELASMDNDCDSEGGSDLLVLETFYSALTSHSAHSAEDPPEYLEEALRSLEVAAQQGNAEAQFIWHLIYRDGLFGLPRRLEDAELCLDRALAGGHRDPEATIQQILKTPPEFHLYLEDPCADLSEPDLSRIRNKTKSKWLDPTSYDKPRRPKYVWNGNSRWTEDKGRSDNEPESPCVRSLVHLPQEPQRRWEPSNSQQCASPSARAKRGAPKRGHQKPIGSSQGLEAASDDTLPTPVHGNPNSSDTKRREELSRENAEAKKATYNGPILDAIKHQGSLGTGTTRDRGTSGAGTDSGDVTAAQTLGGQRDSSDTETRKYVASYASRPKDPEPPGSGRTTSTSSTPSSLSTIPLGGHWILSQPPVKLHVKQRNGLDALGGLSITATGGLSTSLGSTRKHGGMSPADTHRSPSQGMQQDWSSSRPGSLGRPRKFSAEYCDDELPVTGVPGSQSLFRIPATLDGDSQGCALELPRTYREASNLRASNLDDSSRVRRRMLSKSNAIPTPTAGSSKSKSSGSHPFRTRVVPEDFTMGSGDNVHLSSRTSPRNQASEKLERRKGERAAEISRSTIERIVDRIPCQPSRASVGAPLKARRQEDKPLGRQEKNILKAKLKTSVGEAADSHENDGGSGYESPPAADIPSSPSDWQDDKQNSLLLLSELRQVCDRHPVNLRMITAMALHEQAASMVVGMGGRCRDGQRRANLRDMTRFDEEFAELLARSYALYSSVPRIEPVHVTHAIEEKLEAMVLNDTDLCRRNEPNEDRNSISVAATSVYAVRCALFSWLSRFLHRNRLNRPARAQSPSSYIEQEGLAVPSELQLPSTTLGPLALLNTIITSELERQPPRRLSQKEYPPEGDQLPSDAGTHLVRDRSPNAANITESECFTVSPSKVPFGPPAADKHKTLTGNGHEPIPVWQWLALRAKLKYLLLKYVQGAAADYVEALALCSSLDRTYELHYGMVELILAAAREAALPQPYAVWMELLLDHLDQYLSHSPVVDLAPTATDLADVLPFAGAGLLPRAKSLLARWEQRELLRPPSAHRIRNPNARWLISVARVALP